MEARNQANSNRHGSKTSAAPTNLKQDRTSSPHNEHDGKAL